MTGKLRYISMMALLILLSFCSSELSNTWPQKPSGADTNETAGSNHKTENHGIPAGLVCLKKAYPDFIDSVSSNYAYLTDGTKMVWDDGIIKSDFDSLLDYASLKDMMSQCYKAGRNFKIPIDENYDPGRIRHEPIFYKMYGKSKGEVLKNLVAIDWFGRKLKVSKINGADKKLDSVKKELSKLPLEFHKYFVKTAGSFNFRKIAGTSRISAHSFGIAIDLNTEYSHYWRWQKPGSNGKYKYINKMPPEIVEIFEKYGFIWGGKWYHFDTMHFEYRPELLMDGCRCSD